MQPRRDLSEEVAGQRGVAGGRGVEAGRSSDGAKGAEMIGWETEQGPKWGRHTPL